MRCGALTFYWLLLYVSVCSVISGERKRELYVPPAPAEEEMFATIATGINFDKYDDIQSEVTGSEAPPGISR